MKLTNLIAAGLTATLLSTGISYAQTAPARPAEVQLLVKNETAARMPEVVALVEELKAQGFTYIEIRSTLLGRARIMAYGADSLREIVLSSATGEVMRDITRAHDGSLAAGRDAMLAARDAVESNTVGGAAAGISGGITGGISGVMTGGMSGN